ncbi:MAG: 16S rRNA (uracil(1498)-N(3))-methyltransferase [Acidimicrobiia bacterium]|nr:16S rRNA (uracil(1498)-N(3))-methyltransferase [Acidimicrobiia bacterium]
MTLDPRDAESLTRAGAAHVFVDDLDRPELAEVDAHHLRQVLRLKYGESLTVGDGLGSWRLCRFGEQIEPVGPIRTEPAPPYPITVAFSVPKGDRAEMIVRALSELGVDAIVPMQAERSVVRWAGPRGERHVARLTRIAREASMQSRRAFLPAVEPVQVYPDLVKRAGVVVADPGGGDLDPTHRTVLIGPEGGWSQSERDLGPGFLTLSGQVLRVETAAITAGALFAAMRARIVLPPGSVAGRADSG